MHLTEPRALSDGPHPAVGRSPVEAHPVSSPQDRSRGPLSDGEVEGPCGRGHDRHDGRLVPLADDAKSPVTPLEGEVTDAGRAGFAQPKPIQTHEHGQGGVVMVKPLGGGR